MKNIHNKNIVVGITGSIAAYKAADLVSKLKKAGANIKVVMTKSSTSFITERTLESISNNKVLVDENENDEDNNNQDNDDQSGQHILHRTVSLDSDEDIMENIE